MQIIIPMAGFGERFRRAGYRVPKPLIEVEGRPRQIALERRLAEQVEVPQAHGRLQLWVASDPGALAYAHAKA